ncbi:MAG: RNA polymerase subunit sigma [Candidatus Komeilibacteria bacterium CG10_big_fil_rev_8_21_14_0_10_41_13]|uniref:RNA polymerase subunit sigma n=1 Tax=Candidatus Komeilibacteria bacterium CG10_big_fil_rev_8_21_14_0_10_41_13 TaxID=1974476 RepID=A0A2M6WC32_9BACT|nr:MAG: RNA polymerase subunit sigma [Candidatus Komeilibacteria bacterium CG10_big_fil_rev_8_21_14_0_10_41_13]
MTNKNNDHLSKTDQELVALAIKRTDDFKYLIDRYEAKLLRYIRRLSNFSSEDSEDLLQEIFIKVYQNLNSFDDSLKFSSWIYRIAHNQIISQYRKTKSKCKDLEIKADETLVNNLASEFDLKEMIDQKLTSEKLFKLINNLDKKYKEVLILRFFEDKDYREISDILQKPAGTVAALINRAKKQLKHLLLKKRLIFNI